MVFSTPALAPTHDPVHLCEPGDVEVDTDLQREARQGLWRKTRSSPEVPPNPEKRIPSLVVPNDISTDRRAIRFVLGPKDM